MGRAPSFAGVILAAGASSRMGRDKALLPWHGGTFLSAAIRSLAPYTELVVVVAGSNTETLRPVVYANSAFMVENPEPQRGQYSSLRIALSQVLNHGRDAAIITLVDRPAAEGETIAALKQHFLAGVQRTGVPLWAVVPEYEGKHGHPFVAGREMIEAFLRAGDVANAREIEHANQQHIAYLRVADPNVVTNIDTPQQYEQLLQGNTSGVIV